MPRVSTTEKKAEPELKPSPRARAGNGECLECITTEEEKRKLARAHIY
jgi:hypothetical protein